MSLITGGNYIAVGKLEPIAVETSPVRNLETVQPDWDDLPLACELLELRRREQNVDLRTSSFNGGVVGSRKVQHVTRLLELLDLLDEGELTERGQWLTEVYEPALQQSHSGAKLGIGVKDSLSCTEQLLLWMVIFYEHRLPMLAVLHQLSAETVPTTQDSRAAQRFGERIGHLYPDVNSDSSWVPRAKVHYKWLVHLDLAKIRSSSYVLTAIGDSVFEQVESECPDQWNSIQIHTGPTLFDFD
ncbi:hypothetical protein [Natronoarchaeum rubrum]|uniref:hypothetical protein n=1 Tax=Natronoarchaeum rubrum TaxID=755311 RepID=UPI002111562D|nr:hypothetical protein [Natronoarchaeum rubrum]